MLLFFFFLSTSSSSSFFPSFFLSFSLSHPYDEYILLLASCTQVCIANKLFKNNKKKLCVSKNKEDMHNKARFIAPHAWMLFIRFSCIVYHTFVASGEIKKNWFHWVKENSFLTFSGFHCVYGVDAGAKYLLEIQKIKYYKLLRAPQILRLKVGGIYLYPILNCFYLCHRSCAVTRRCWCRMLVIWSRI